MTPAERVSSRKKKVVAKQRPVVWDCRLREHRLRLCLTQRDVEKATGISNAFVCQVENGSELSLTHATILAEFFGVEVGAIWPRRIASKEAAK